MNWYKYSQIIERLRQQAGWKENTLSGLMGAIILVFLGSGIANAAKKMNVSEKEVIESLQDETLTNQAKQIAEQIQTGETIKPSIKAPILNINDFIDAILIHEGLIPGQTPFRYTSKTMREWDHIHGFEIDKTSPRPKNRQNFIFLKNPADVPKAVKVQFEKYKSSPSNYEWNHEPTLKEAIEKFDQTGAVDKMKFLKEKFPSLDFNKLLSEVFSY